MTANRRPTAQQPAASPAPIYMTPACAQRLRAELKELLYRLRPAMVNTVAWAASNGDRSENADYQYAKRRLRHYDSRIRFLSKRLENATIVDPAEQGKIANGRVLFGATVTVENGHGEEKVYTVVGEDEFDPARGCVSWKSPIGRALLGRREGDVVAVITPGGRLELEIVRVDYRGS